MPGGGVGTQALARRVVALMLLVAGAGVATVPMAAAAVSEPPQAGGAAVEPAADRAGHAAAASPAAEAADPQAAGRLPSQATRTAERAEREGLRYYQVKPPQNRNYDTLWDIAERYLGSGLRYKEIAAAQPGVLQPDGSRLVNPDLIQPGWMLRLPADAEGVGLLVADPTQPGVSPRRSRSPSAASTSVRCPRSRDQAHEAGPPGRRPPAPPPRPPPAAAPPTPA